MKERSAIARAICHFAVVAAVFATVLFTAPVVSAQALPPGPIPIYLQRNSLLDTNLGRSALAIQATCLELVGIRNDPNQPALPSEGEELFLRCNELVVTSLEFNNDQPNTGPARTLGYCEGSGCQSDDSSNGELLAAFQQVNGEEAQASSNLSKSAAYEQFSMVNARLAALRGATSASVTSVAANSGDIMYGSGGGAAADANAPFSPWGWFIRGTYTSGERDPSDASSFSGQENGFDYDQYGVTVGIDRRSGNAVWGLAVGYNSYEVEMQTVDPAGIPLNSVVAGGTIDTDSVNATVYFDFLSDNNVYVNLLTGFGTQSFDMLRNFIYLEQAAGTPDVTDQVRQMVAEPDGDSFSIALTLGRSIVNRRWTFNPYIGLTYDAVNIDGYAESDSGNISQSSTTEGMQLAFDKQEIDSTRSRLGFQVDYNINTDFGSVRPTFSAEWIHEFDDDPLIVRTKYALEDGLAEAYTGSEFQAGFDSCVSCFNLVSEDPDTDYAVLALGLGAYTQRGFQSFLMVEGLVGHSFLSAYAVTVGIRGQF